MSEKSVVFVRIDNKHLEVLGILASIDNSTIADEIRNAIESYISSRISNKDVADRIAKIKERRDSRLRKLLDRQ